MARFGLFGDPAQTPMREFAHGLQALGHHVVWRDHYAWSGAHEQFDAVATFGARAQAADLIAHYEKRGAPAVVIDHGYVRRVHTRADYAEGHFQVGIGRIGWVPKEQTPSDRWDALKVDLRARSKRPVRDVLILAQTPLDASHLLTTGQLCATYAKLKAELKAAGARTVLIRPHPLADPMPLPVDSAPYDTLNEAVSWADAVASINSNAGLDAIMSGCPSIHLRASHYAELSWRWPVPLSIIEAPEPARVLRFLHRLAYAQWTAEEMAAGAPQRFLARIGAIP